METTPHQPPAGLLLDVSDLVVHLPLRRGRLVSRRVGQVCAVDGVSLRIERGHSYGLLGESGSGKSVIGRVVAGLQSATTGRVLRTGRCRLVQRLPPESLDQRGSVESRLLAAGADRSSLRELLELVQLPDSVLPRRPAELAGAQRQRVAIAEALGGRPDLLVVDEPVAGLEVSEQAQVLNLLAALRRRLDLGYLMISRDLTVVRYLCDRIGVLYGGELIEEAPAALLSTDPRHPYTRALVSAVPVPDPEVEDRRRPILLAGEPPRPGAMPPGCRFHPRCPWQRDPLCSQARPQLRAAEGSSSEHQVACHHAEIVARECPAGL